jgi:hypothetical protein
LVLTTEAASSALTMLGSCILVRFRVARPVIHGICRDSYDVRINAEDAYYTYGNRGEKGKGWMAKVESTTARI